MDFLFSRKRNLQKRRMLVLRLQAVHEWDYEIERAWRRARRLPE